MVLFTCNIIKIKGAAYKNGDVDGTCKRAFKNNERGASVAKFYMK